MLESLEDVNKFLDTDNKEASVYDTWVLDGYKINPELVNEEDVIPVGLHQMSSQDVRALRDTLCVAGNPEKQLILLVVNLDKDDKSAEEIALTAYRWTSHVAYAAMIMVSRSDDRIVEAETQLRDKEILKNEAVILTHIE